MRSQDARESSGYDPNVDTWIRDGLRHDHAESLAAAYSEDAFRTFEAVRLAYRAASLSTDDYLAARAIYEAAR